MWPGWHNHIPWIWLQTLSNLFPTKWNKKLFQKVFFFPKLITFRVTPTLNVTPTQKSPTLNVAQMAKSHTLNMTPNFFEPLLHETEQIEQKAFSKFFFSPLTTSRVGSYPECDPNSKKSPTLNVTQTRQPHTLNMTPNLFKLVFWKTKQRKQKTFFPMLITFRVGSYPEYGPTQEITYPEYGLT